VDLCAAPAVDLARMIQSRELSATELLEAVLARVEAVNPSVNAIITLAAEQARDAARDLDARAARGSFAGPLHGLPIAIKDLAETAGIRTTYGSPIFASYVPDFDAPHVALLKAAGAVVIGLDPSGLPVGLQLVAPYGADRRLLEIAAAVMALA
jgi:amidase